MIEGEFAVKYNIIKFNRDCFRINLNMIRQIFIESVVGGGLFGLKSYNVHGENSKRMPVQGLKQPIHLENPTPHHR
jgi:hypothetical protein